MGLCALLAMPALQHCTAGVAGGSAHVHCFSAQWWLRGGHENVRTLLLQRAAAMLLLRLLHLPLPYLRWSMRCLHQLLLHKPVASTSAVKRCDDVLF